MGDRALVVFTDSNGQISPTVYLHWSGAYVPELIDQLREYMKGREGDMEYSCARFIGLCHKRLKDGNVSLGVWNTPNHDKEGDDILPGSVQWDDWAKSYSHGDAGVILCDVSNDHRCKTYGGYLRVDEDGRLYEPGDNHS